MTTTRKDGAPRKLTPAWYRVERVAGVSEAALDRVAKARKRKAHKALAR